MHYHISRCSWEIIPYQGLINWLLALKARGWIRFGWWVCGISLRPFHLCTHCTNSREPITKTSRCQLICLGSHAQWTVLIRTKIQHHSIWCLLPFYRHLIFYLYLLVCLLRQEMVSQAGFKFTQPYCFNWDYKYISIMSCLAWFFFCQLDTVWSHLGGNPNWENVCIRLAYR